MRILQITSASSFAGGERYVVDLSNSLTERGHEVFVALRPGSPLVEYLRVPPDHIKALPLRNALDAPSARALARLVRQQQIQIVHAHMARDYSLAAYASRAAKAKFVVTRHVLFALNRLHRRTLLKAHKVIAVSAAVARQLSSQNLVSDNRIALVPNGINVERFAAACKQFDRSEYLTGKGIPANCMLVGSIAELRSLKRHDDLIRAAALVVRKIANAHFVIAGVDTSATGENKKQLSALAAQLDVADRVHFLGWLNDAEKLLCAIDVFVSASETESFGLSIVEAMAAGTAVVATRTEGAQEIIEDQATGLLVPIGNVEQIAAAIVELLSDIERRKVMGSRARDSAQERFSLERMVDQIERIYID